MIGVPVLDTARLILRGHTLDDFSAYAEWREPTTILFRDP